MQLNKLTFGDIVELRAPVVDLARMDPEFFSNFGCRAPRLVG